MDREPRDNTRRIIEAGKKGAAEAAELDTTKALEMLLRAYRKMGLEPVIGVESEIQIIRNEIKIPKEKVPTNEEVLDMVRGAFQTADGGAGIDPVAFAAMLRIAVEKKINFNFDLLLAHLEDLPDKPESSDLSGDLRIQAHVLLTALEAQNQGISLYSAGIEHGLKPQDLKEEEFNTSDLGKENVAVFHPEHAIRHGRPEDVIRDTNRLVGIQCDVAKKLGFTPSLAPRPKFTSNERFGAGKHIHLSIHDASTGGNLLRNVGVFDSMGMSNEYRITLLGEAMTLGIGKLLSENVGMDTETSNYLMYGANRLDYGFTKLGNVLRVNRNDIESTKFPDYDNIQTAAVIMLAGGLLGIMNSMGIDDEVLMGVRGKGAERLDKLVEGFESNGGIAGLRFRSGQTKPVGVKEKITEMTERDPDTSVLKGDVINMIFGGDIKVDPRHMGNGKGTAFTVIV